MQHRAPHQHTGDEMEVLTTLGEQVGCALELARIAAQPANQMSGTHVDLVISSAPVRPVN